MKQRLHGRKVQNWHQPLGRGQLKHRYRQRRHDIALDEDWVWEDYDWDDRREDCFEDLRSAELKQLLREVLRRPEPLFRLEWAVDAALRSTEEPVVTLDAAQLEERLATFVQWITHFPNDPVTQRELRACIGEDTHDDLLRAAKKRAAGENLVRNACLFAPFWIRSPRTWDGSKSLLIDHLFVRFSVPRFLYGTWTQEPCFSRLKWLCWFILLAQGGSLRRSRAQFGWNIPNRFEHFLRMTSADTESPVAEVSTAQILRLGGSLEDCRRVLANSAFVIDTTERAWESQAEFWETTVCWIIAHGNSLSDDQCEQVLAWAMHEHTEAERHRVPPFLLKGKGLRAVLERSLAYRRQLARPWSGYRWRQRGWGWQPVDPPLEGWSFVELTSGEELFCEGQALHHCVATYAGQCAAGNAVIVSVRFMGERRLTIEIQPSTGLVIQAKGKRNRPASGDEQRVIRRWLERVVVPSLVNSPR